MSYIIQLLFAFSTCSFACGAMTVVVVQHIRARIPRASFQLAGDADDDDENERQMTLRAQSDKDVRDPQRPMKDDWGLLDAPYKMLLCVNMELRDEHGKPTKMKPGKMAAQCCHACLGAYKLARKHAPSAVRSWALTGQAKVCVKVPTEAHLFELKESLERVGICAYLVEDAGRTQVPFCAVALSTVQPALSPQVAPGSHTVLAVGPAPVKVLDKYTRHLKLY